MLAIDISYWTGNVSVETFRKFKEAGYELVIVGLWHGASINGHAYHQVENALVAGLHVAGYAALSGLYSPELQIGWSQAALQDDVDTNPFWSQLKFVAVDVELVGVSPQDIITAVNTVRSLGQRPIVYTARWFWLERLGNPCILQDVPLWNAFYDGDPDVDFPMFPYGCWERTIGYRAGQATHGLIGEQYIGTTTIFNTVVDVNWFDPAYVLDEEEEVALTVDEIRALIDEETSYPLLLQPEGRKEVYELVGDTIYHIENPPTFAGKDFRWDRIKVYPVSHEIWKRRVVYPAGVPITLLLPGVS